MDDHRKFDTKMGSFRNFVKGLYCRQKSSFTDNHEIFIDLFINIYSKAIFNRIYIMKKIKYIYERNKHNASASLKYQHFYGK